MTRGRISVRRAQRQNRVGQGASGAGASIWQTILGSNLIIELDARFQSSAGSWTDRRRQLQLTNVANPTTYAVDGSHFKGLPVHQTNVAPGAVLRALTPNPVIYSAGARPYMFCVSRARAYPAGGAVLCCRVLDAPLAANTIVAQSSGGNTIQGLVDSGGSTAPANTFGNTGVHAIEVWTEAAGSFTAIDGLTVATGAAVTLTNNSGHISIGGNHLGAGLLSDSSHALVLLCTAVPTLAQRQQLLDMAELIWGFGPPQDTTTAEYWDAAVAESIALGVAPAVNTWTGLFAGKVTTKASASPQYPFTDALFKNTPVLQTIRAGAGSLIGLGNNVVAAGTRPYMFSQARLTTQPSNGQSGTILALARQASEGGAATGQLQGARDPAVGNNWAGIFINAAISVPSVAAQDLNAHTFESWLDGVNANLRVDGALSQAATAATLNVGNTTGIGNYGADNNTNHHTDARHAFHMICNAKPTEAYVARLKSWISRYKGGAPGNCPLPKSVVAAWFSDLNCLPASWTDYVGGRVLTGTGTPVVAADGSLFNGRAVAQTAAAGNFWRNAALATVLATGTRPWAYTIGRFRSVAATVTLTSYGRPAGSHDLSIQNVAGAPTTYRGFFLGTIASSSPTPSDTSPHRFKGWLDGTNANLTVDAANYTAASAASLAGNVTAVAVGANAADGTGPGDCSVAFHLLCSEKPTAAEEQALDAWSAAYYGV